MILNNITILELNKRIGEKFSGKLKYNAQESIVENTVLLDDADSLEPVVEVLEQEEDEVK